MYPRVNDPLFNLGAHLLNQKQNTVPLAELQHETIAVDFDGTLCYDLYPNIGVPKTNVINYIKRKSAEGSKIILYTSRENAPDGGRAFLDEAVDWCKEQGVPLDAVNENL